MGRVRATAGRRSRALRAMALAGLLACLLGSRAGGQDGGGDLLLPDLDHFDCPAPAMRVRRPDDSWAFVDLRAAQESDRAAGRDLRQYETLRARLWQGSTRSSIYVQSWDELRPELTSEVVGREHVAAARAGFPAVEVRREGPAQVGTRAGYVFEALARTDPRPGPPTLAVLKAVVYRPDDHVVIALLLECTPDQVEPARRSFARLLRSVRL